MRYVYKSHRSNGFRIYFNLPRNPINVLRHNGHTTGADPGPPGTKVSIRIEPVRPHVRKDM